MLISSATTYEMLDKILTRLDFEKKTFDATHIRYFHRESDVLLILPEGAPNEKVWGANLITAQRMIVWKGVATEEEFAAIVKAVEKETEAAKEAERAAAPPPAAKRPRKKTAASLAVK